MFTHPYIGSQLARERQREMLAQAGQQRLGRQLRNLARASRRAEGTGRRQRRVLGTPLRLRLRVQASPRMTSQQSQEWLT
jgi:hypothetical protein